MSVLSRIIGRKSAAEPDLRSLWHDVVKVSREPEWYTQGGVADTVDGRVDMITIIMAFVLLRMERSEVIAPLTARLTEHFIADMDRQLRDRGVGDLMVGKNIGKLMEVLGGRMGTLRRHMDDSDAKLAEILARNVALADEERKPFAFAVRCRALAGELAARDDRDLLAGRIRA